MKTLYCEASDTKYWLNERRILIREPFATRRNKEMLKIVPGDTISYKNRIITWSCDCRSGWHLSARRDMSAGLQVTEEVVSARVLAGFYFYRHCVAVTRWKWNCMDFQDGARNELFERRTVFIGVIIVSAGYTINTEISWKDIWSIGFKIEFSSIVAKFSAMNSDTSMAGGW